MTAVRVLLLPLAVAIIGTSGCMAVRRWPTEKDFRPLPAVFHRISKNVVAAQESLRGDFDFRAEIVETGFLDVATDQVVVTKYWGNTAVSRQFKSGKRLPYVVVRDREGPGAGLVFCVLREGWGGDLRDADAGRTVIASGEFEQAFANPVPTVVLSSCRVFGVEVPANAHPPNHPHALSLTSEAQQTRGATVDVRIAV